MNYLKTYCNLIRKAEERGYTRKKAKELEIYVEGHHTFPKSIFGKNKRTVLLTAREHYIAHALLWKSCEKRYGKNHNKTIKCLHAFWMMNVHMRSKRNVFNSILYEKCKVNKIEDMKNNHPMQNEKSRAKVSNKMKGRYTGENNPAKKPEVRQKIRNALIGRFFTEERKKNVSDALYKQKFNKYAKLYEFEWKGQIIKEYNTIRQLSKKYNIPKTTLLRKLGRIK
jgi:hypothetical protein